MEDGETTLGIFLPPNDQMVRATEPTAGAFVRHSTYGEQPATCHHLRCLTEGMSSSIDIAAVRVTWTCQRYMENLCGEQS